MHSLKSALILRIAGFRSDSADMRLPCNGLLAGVPSRFVGLP